MSTTAEAIDTSAIPAGLGASKPIELPATRYMQGARTMYHVTVTLARLTQLIVKRPDPDHPIEGNRKVDAGRARKFGRYVLENEGWVSPGIIVRVPSGEVQFSKLHGFDDGTSWGVLEIPLHVLTEILLLDGQHRTLGTFVALDEINERIRKTQDTIKAARRNDTPEVVAEFEKKLEDHKEARRRLVEEHISVDIAVVDTNDAKQIFADINNNAKGVNPDYTTILDQREVVNRLAAELIEEHPLLEGRVELGQSTRMSTTNPNLVGAKTVADIVRTVHVGVTGRIGAKVEDELAKNSPAAAARVKTFLDILVSSFEELQSVIDGDIEPVDLRAEGSENRSMIGSATMLRVLAGVYHEVTKKAKELGDAKPMTRSEIEGFFKKLAPKLREIPIKENDRFWLPTEAFIPGTSAPQARQGTMAALVQAMVTWAREGHRQLD